MRSIRAGSGLGDAMYLQAVVRHLTRNGERFRVNTDWRDVFLPLAGRVELAPFNRKADLCAHYSLRKGRKDTDQFQDCCIQAGITEPVEFRMDWAPRNTALIQRVRASGRPVLLVQLPRAPMGRRDGFGAELLPDTAVMQALLDQLGRHFCTVQIGSGAPLYRFTGIEIDLAGNTSICDLLDLGVSADAMFGYCSYMVPLAEQFDKPALFVWSARGLRSGKAFVNQITPAKILHKDTSHHVIDAECRDPAATAVAFLQSIGRC